MLLQNFTIDYQSKKDKETIQHIANVDNEDALEIDFEALKKVNNDLVAWLYIPDTNINYPIVQSDDNSFYLTHDFHKDTNKHGSIFLDYRQSLEELDPDTYLYGHNMRNKEMFADLEKFLDQEFYDQHPYVYIFTEHGNFRCVVLAIKEQNEMDTIGTTFVNRDKSFLNYVSSIAQSDIDFTLEDSLLTLYTCSYSSGKSANTDLRYLLHTKIVPWSGTLKDAT